MNEEQRQHIDLIQGAVGRMASASSTAKGWLLPVVTAAYGYALTKSEWSVAGLGLLAAVLFGILDAHYLRQERAFRALYRSAVQAKVDVYEMNYTRFYGKRNNDPDDEREINCRWGKVIFSWTVGGFYGPVIVVGLLIMIKSDWTDLSACILP